jgi:hypothetical protein
MSIEGIVVGLLAIAVGLAWAFYGLKAFTILLPIWAFFVGLLAGASWGQEFLGQGFFGTVTSWVLGLVIGIVLALISYFWYYGAIALIGGAIGYTLGAGLLAAIGLTGFLSVVVGLIVAAAVAILVIVLAVPVWLVIFLSAIGGAVAAVNGLWILLGQIKLDDISSGLGEGLIRQGFLSWVLVFLVAAAGVFYQMRSLGRTVMTAEAEIDRARYRY